MTTTLTQGGTLLDQSEEIQQKVGRALGNQTLARTYRELPLVQYKSRAFDLFGSLFNTIRTGVVSRMFRLRAAAPAKAGMGVTPAQAGAKPTRAGSPGKPGKSKRRRRRRK
jgi:preprotein translocase subunit SecA